MFCESNACIRDRNSDQYTLDVSSHCFYMGFEAIRSRKNCEARTKKYFCLLTLFLSQKLKCGRICPLSSLVKNNK